MDTFGTLVLWTFATIGVLAVVSSVGVFVMTYRLDDPDPDVAAIVEAHTQPSHVRVVPAPPSPLADFTPTGFSIRDDRDAS